MPESLVGTVIEHMDAWVSVMGSRGCFCVQLIMLSRRHLGREDVVNRSGSVLETGVEL